MKTPSPKLYRLQSESGHFYAGYLPDGTQVFMTVAYPNLLAVLFDPGGRYLKLLIRELSPETQAGLKLAYTDEAWSRFNGDWEELDRWAAELGFTQGVIAVQKFSLPEHDLSIVDLPPVYQEILDNCDEVDEEMKEQIRDWQEVNDYVLILGNDYDIDFEGKVVST